MSKQKFTVGRGHAVSLPAHLGTAPGAAVLRLVGPGVFGPDGVELPASEPIELDGDDAFVRRSRNRGALVPLNTEVARPVATMASSATTAKE